MASNTEAPSMSLRRCGVEICQRVSDIETGIPPSPCGCRAVPRVILPPEDICAVLFKVLDDCGIAITSFAH